VVRVLVTGARGLLGSVLSRVAGERGLRVLATSREELDITDPVAVEAVLERFSPDVVYNCAAFSAVDRAEAHPREALRVNRDGPGHLARGAGAHGAVLVHIGTDYVFDGRKTSPYLPTDRPGPLNVYGISKLAGELAVRETAPEHLVVRTSWLFGPGGSGFVSVMSRLFAEDGGPVRVVEDEVSRPTFVEDLAPALLDLVAAGSRGLLHLAGSGHCNRLELAEEIREILGGHRALVGVSARAYGAPARRPPYSVLDLEDAFRALGRGLPHWRESLGVFLSGSDSPPSEWRRSE
jgi:dTDP-4-dehydrorhamnose reductase